MIFRRKLKRIRATPFAGPLSERKAVGIIAAAKRMAGYSTPDAAIDMRPVVPRIKAASRKLNAEL